MTPTSAPLPRLFESNQPGHIHPHTGRLCVTALEASKRPDPDSPLFLYEPSSDEWELLEGIDPMVDGSAVDIWTYAGRCISGCSVSTPVYLGRKESDRLAEAEQCRWLARWFQEDSRFLYAVAAEYRDAGSKAIGHVAAIQENAARSALVAREAFARAQEWAA